MNLHTYIRTHDQAAQVAEAMLNAEWTGAHEVTIRPKNKRSVPQNNAGHGWYRTIAKELGGTEEDVKCECKLRFGIPILRADDEEFREWYDSLVKNRFSYEEKLELMRRMPVTSLMNKQQKSWYLEQVQAEYAKQGIQLEFGEAASNDA